MIEWGISAAAHDASLTVAIGFAEDLATVRQAQQNLSDVEISAVGYVQPGEVVKESSDADFDSVALGQLINLYSQTPIASYPLTLPSNKSVLK